MSSEAKMDADQHKHGCIVEIALGNLRGKTIHALCEQLTWHLPAGEEIADACYDASSNALCLKLRSPGPSCLPIVHEGAAYPQLELFPDARPAA